MRAISEQVHLVTGATQGIGKEAARALAKAGARVIITARDAARGAAVVDELKRDTGNDKIELALVDFASFASVRAFLDDINQRVDRLDVLVNNAGAYHDKPQATVDGYDMTFQVNHLGYFMTTLGLLEKLKAAGDARVVCVSSGAHLGARINFDALGKPGLSGFRPYAMSKLMNILFVREAAKRFPASISINAFHPGMVASGFGGDRGAVGLWYKLAKPIMKTSAQGADTAVWLATAPEVHGVTGKYFAKRKEAVTSPAAKDDNSARRLWEASEKMSGITD